MAKLKQRIRIPLFVVAYVLSNCTPAKLGISVVHHLPIPKHSPVPLTVEVIPRLFAFVTFHRGYWLHSLHSHLIELLIPSITQVSARMTLPAHNYLRL